MVGFYCIINVQKKNIQNMSVLPSSLLGETKAFFCFWFNKTITKKATWQLKVFKVQTSKKKLQNHVSPLKLSTWKKDEKVLQ